MRAAYFLGPGSVAWREVPPPALSGPGSALVRPLAVAMCDLDTAMLRGQVPHPPAPFPFGHESVAEVVAVGEAVTAVDVGQRVVVPCQLSCGTCDRCLSGRTGRCRTLGGTPMFGLGALGGDRPGVLADLVEVPFADGALVAAPEGPPLAALPSLSDNLPDAWRTVAGPLEAAPGSDVLVVGGGAISIALYAVAVARALGAGDVHYLDEHPSRRDQARRLGARAHAPGDRLPRTPVTVEAAGTGEGLLLALDRTDLDGICTSVSIHLSPVELPLLAMYSRGVRFVIGRPHVRHLLPELIEVLDAGRLDPLAIATEIAPWDEAPSVLTAPADKVVLVRARQEWAP
jgi:threonine dehydrogenase-like Zn-dependent dehydrogenase